MMRDDNYLDGLIAGGTVAISFAGLILLIVSNLKNEAETEKNTAFYEWAASHCEKIENNLNVTEKSKTFKCDDGKIYTIK
ncbi:hypothetical protein C3U77_005012 [Escherichia coli]|nr:hypothetical protein [Escherichia coli]EEY2486431.1 hypothetical protein [Escherichia coli]EEY3064219.1 hypothetical protein [Escherichia coli]EFA6039118.1 hypothetical protein [Escherichia coli]EFA7788815.1 hypothetical protein [Escherichia coli]